METWKAFEQNVCDKCGEMSGYNSWQRLNDSKEVKGERGWFNRRCKIWFRRFAPNIDKILSICCSTQILKSHIEIRKNLQNSKFKCSKPPRVLLFRSFVFLVFGDLFRILCLGFRISFSLYCVSHLFAAGSAR